MAERSGCHLRRESAEGGDDFFERGRALLLEPWFQLFYQTGGEKVKIPFLAVSEVAPNGAVKIVKKSRSKTAF